MNAFLKHLSVQFKMDVREKGTLMTFYIIPLTFFAVMGAVFSSINAASKETLTSSMIIFATTMGAVLGIPIPLIDMRESGVLRAYRVNGIPGPAVLLIQAASAFLHLSVTSLIILITAPILFGASLPKNYGAFFLILICLLFTNIMLGLLIGVTCRSQSSSTMLSQAIFLPSLMLSGIMFPSDMLPKPLMLLGRIFPATHIMQSFSGLAFGLSTQYSPVLALGICVCIGAAAAAFAFGRFHAAGRAQA